MRKYVLEMDEKQARIASAALELYSRLRMGQWKELVWLCLDLSDDEFCEKRDALEEKLIEARAVAFPELSKSFGHSYGVGKFKDGDMSWELYEVLRHCMAWTEHPEGGITVNFDKPMSFSGHPLAKCSAIEEKEKGEANGKKKGR